jgi:ketosteroid isomerase-like protein
VITEVGGNRYIVSMFGSISDWVRNAEAAHGDAVISHGRSVRVRLVRVVPEQRAPILREYVRVASSGRKHFPVPVGAPLEDFAAIAEQYPVYRIDGPTSVPAQDSCAVQMVRDLYGAFGRRDIAAILSVLSPEVEWTEPDHPSNPCGGTRHGHAGFLEWARIGSEVEDILTLEPRLFLSGEDNVAVIGHTRCRVKSTGRIYETDFVHLIGFHNGQIVRFQEFFDTYAAGEAFRPPAGSGPWCRLESRP